MPRASHRSSSPRRIQSGHWRHSVARRRRRRLPGWARLALFIFAVGVAVVWSWRIQSVDVSGGDHIPLAAVRNAVLNELAGKRWGLVPQSSMLLSDTALIEDRIREEFVFASVVARRTLHRELRIIVEPHEVFAITSFSGGMHGALSSTGILHSLALVPVPVVTEASWLRFVWPGDAPALGTQVMSTAALSGLQRLWETLQTATDPLPPTRVVPLGQSVTDFVIETDLGTQVLVSTTVDIAGQNEKLRAILRDQQLAPDVLPTRIDVRFGERVYIE
jgi:hypothetical protein